MITLEALLAASQKGKVYLHYHVTKDYSQTWRQNGAIKTWKTRPGHYRMPIKHGIYDYDCLTHLDNGVWELADECPICNKEKD